MAGNDINLYSVPTDSDRDDVRLRAQTAAGVTGTLNKTEAADTVAATGTVLVKASLTKTEAADTITATGAVTVAAALTKTEAADTVSATGAVLVKGSAAITEGADTISATGNVTTGSTTVTATANINEAADTVLATGTTSGSVAPISGVGLGGAMVDYARRRSKRNKQARKAQRAALWEQIAASVRAQTVEEAPAVEVVAQVVADIRPMLAYDIAPARIVERLPAKPLLTQELVDRLTKAILAEIAANDDEEAAFMLLVA